MIKESDDFFWPSYVDLLTALFIVMLVLFVLSHKLLSDTVEATKNQLDVMKEVQSISERLPRKFFAYQEEYKRWTLIQPTQFRTGSADIPRSDYGYLKEVGDSLVQMLDTLQRKYQNLNLKYLIIIEGMASRIGQNPDPNNLSYRRANALYEFWLSNNIEFDKNVCEVMIVGSGISGIGRYPFDPPSFDQERQNQRILIQIIPKTSRASEGDNS